MYWLDTTILAILAIGAIFGALSGLLMQLARLVGFAIALYAAIRLNDPVTAQLRDGLVQDAEPWVTRVLAYVLVFLAVYLTIYLTTVVIERAMRAARLQALNRLLGAVLGMAKAALLLGAIFLGVSHFSSEGRREMLERSALAPMLARGTEQLVSVLASDYREELRGGLEDLSKSLREKAGAPVALEDLELP